MSNYTLISADGPSGPVRATVQKYAIRGVGTWGSGTLTPQEKFYDGTWITLGSTTLTANGVINVEVAPGTEIRANLSGSTSPSLKVHISKIGN